MNCPKCQTQFQQFIFGSVEVDRCPQCKGFWFDEFELDDLLKSAGSACIDFGDPQVGKKYNKIDRIQCPKCTTTPLMRMVHPQQSHIWFEHCKVCGGSFLDAGEFKDMKEKTISDFFKSLLSRERK